MQRDSSLIDEVHPEDIKAAIRKRYRSVRRFEVAEKLARNGVADMLRGRKSRRTEVAVRRVLAEDEKWGGLKSIASEASADSRANQPLNAVRI